jgi:hypothetical protein
MANQSLGWVETINFGTTIYFIDRQTDRNPCMRYGRYVGKGTDYPTKHLVLAHDTGGGDIILEFLGDQISTSKEKVVEALAEELREKIIYAESDLENLKRDRRLLLGEEKDNSLNYP